MLAIAILLGIAMILNIHDTKGNYNMLIAAPLCISLYALNLVVFACTVVVLICIGILWYNENK